MNTWNSPIFSITLVGVFIIVLFGSILNIWCTGWVPWVPIDPLNALFGITTFCFSMLVGGSAAKRMGYSVDLFDSEPEESTGSLSQQSGSQQAGERKSAKFSITSIVLAVLLYVSGIIWFTYVFEYLVPDEIRAYLVSAILVVMALCFLYLRNGK